MTLSGEQYHLVGIAGVGMSALAEILLLRGCQVTGSDRFMDQGRNLEVLWKLKRFGARLTSQDGSGVGKWTAAVVVSSAIEDDNPDLLAAKEHGVPILHRAEMLASLAEGKSLVAIAGTSGKTTVTGMVGWLLERCDKDPTAVNGGSVRNWLSETSLGNVRCGRSDLWVLEADESDRSFLKFSPDWAVITNISQDHFELDEAIDLFAEFAGRINSGLVLGSEASKVLEGRIPDDLTVVVAPALGDVTGAVNTFEYNGVAFEMPLLGKHNIENALHAVVLCEQLGCPLEILRDALSEFKGIGRRLEKVGEANGVTVIDEYAHNPAKISAAWSAVAEQHSKILGVWRPHGFTPLRLMMDDLVDTFREVCREEDCLYLLPVFYAGGTADDSVSSEQLANLLSAHGTNVRLVDGYEELQPILTAQAEDGAAILCMGARDPQLPEFAREMVKKLV